MRPGALTQAARTAASRRDAEEAARPRRAAAAPRAKRAVAQARAQHAPAASRVQRAATAAPRVQRAATAAPRTQRVATAARPKRAAEAARPKRAGSSRGSRPPRRVSGPLRGALATGPSLSVRAATIALPLPLRPFGPRQREAKPPATLRERCRSFVTSLPDHHLLDRAVRGRSWIPLLGILLAGIVAAQVDILKLGASMGRSLEQTTTLTSQNETLRASVATLSNDQRIERFAAGMGMVNPPPGAVGYLAAQPGGNVSGARSNLHTPSPSSFVFLTPQNGALVTGQGSSTLPATEDPATLATPSGTTSTSTTPGATTSDPAAGSQSSTDSTDTTTQDSTTSSDTTAAQTTPDSQSTPTQTPTATQTPTQTETPTGTPTGPSSTDAQAPATGAAAVGPTDSSQQSTGG